MAAARGLYIGARVDLPTKGWWNCGTVRYLGPVKFASSEWAGIELDQPLGQNDGEVQGHRYFMTRPNHGIFTRSFQVKVSDAAAPPAATSTPASQTQTASSATAASGSRDDVLARARAALARSSSAKSVTSVASSSASQAPPPVPAPVPAPAPALAPALAPAYSAAGRRPSEVSSASSAFPASARRQSMDSSSALRSPTGSQAAASPITAPRTAAVSSHRLGGDTSSARSSPAASQSPDPGSPDALGSAFAALDTADANTSSISANTGVDPLRAVPPAKPVAVPSAAAAATRTSLWASLAPTPAVVPPAPAPVPASAPWLPYHTQQLLQAVKPYGSGGIDWNAVAASMGRSPIECLQKFIEASSSSNAAPLPTATSPVRMPAFSQPTPLSPVINANLSRLFSEIEAQNAKLSQDVARLTAFQASESMRMSSIPSVPAFTAPTLHLNSSLHGQFPDMNSSRAGLSMSQLHPQFTMPAAPIMPTAVPIAAPAPAVAPSFAPTTSFALPVTQPMMHQVAQPVSEAIAAEHRAVHAETELARAQEELARAREQASVQRDELVKTIGQLQSSQQPASAAPQRLTAQDLGPSIPTLVQRVAENMGLFILPGLSLERQLEQIAQSAQDLTQRADRTTNAWESQSSRFKQLETALSQLREELQSAKSQLAATTSAQHKAESDANHWKRECEAVRHLLSKEQTDRTAIERRISQAVQEQSEALETSIKTLRKQLENAKEKAEHWKSQATSFQQQVAALERERDRMRADLEITGQFSASLLSEKEQLKGQCQFITRELHEVRQALAHRQQQMSALMNVGPMLDDSIGPGGAPPPSSASMFEASGWSGAPMAAFPPGARSPDTSAMHISDLRPKLSPSRFGGTGADVEWKAYRDAPMTVQEVSDDSLGHPSGSGLTKPVKQSNHQRLKMALTQVCLAAPHAATRRQMALDVLSAATNSNCILLFFDEKPASFRAIYALTPDLKKGVRIFGNGPVSLTAERVSVFYKYDSAARDFRRLPTRTFTVTTDAVSLDSATRTLTSP